MLFYQNVIVLRCFSNLTGYKGVTCSSNWYLLPFSSRNLQQKQTQIVIFNYTPKCSMFTFKVNNNRMDRANRKCRTMNTKQWLPASVYSRSRVVRPWFPHVSISTASKQPSIQAGWSLGIWKQPPTHRNPLQMPSKSFQPTGKAEKRLPDSTLFSTRSDSFLFANRNWRGKVKSLKTLFCSNVEENYTCIMCTS